MLVRCWQAAILAATMALAMNAARAEDPPAKGKCGDCCKDKECSKCGDCCQNKGGYKKEDCCKNKECCKGACGSCGCCCCPAKGEQAKKATVYVRVFVPVPVPLTPGPFCTVMPNPLPPPAPACALLPPSLIPPVMPPQNIAMPMPPPPCCICPSSAAPAYCAMPCPLAAAPEAGMDIDSWLSLLGMAADLCCSRWQPPTVPSLCVSALGLLADLCDQRCSTNLAPPMPNYLQQPPPYVSPAPEWVTQGPTPAPVLPPPVQTCSISTPATPAASAANVRIMANASDHQLEMSIGDDGCMSCKKMSMKVGDCSLTLTNVDGRIHVRAPELKAKADCIRTDRKDRLILEGDAVLHYRKDGQCTHVTAERIELNLATGSVTIKPIAAPVKPASIGQTILYDGVGP